MIASFFKNYKKDLWAIILLSFVIALIFSPLLFGGQVFYDQEQFGFYYPMSFYVQKSIENNIPLLWNNAYYGGVSAALDQFVGAYYPVNLFLFKHLDFIDAHHLSITLATITGVLFAYWFGRANEWHISSSIIFTLSYLLATTFSWLSIGTIAAHSFITMPAMAFSILKIRENKNFLWYSLLGGIAFGVGILAGFIQIVFYVYPILFLYALFLDWQVWDKSKHFFEKHRSVLSFIAMSFIGVGLGIKQLMPSILFIDRTIRTSDYAIQNASSPGVIQFLTFILPDYIRTPFLGGGTHGFYIGVLPIIFAVIALIFYRSKTLIFFASVYLIVLGFAMHWPIFSWLNEHLPPYRNMGGHLRWMLAGAFPLAFMGAYGFDNFIRNPSKIREAGYRNLLKILLLISSLFVLGTLVLNYILNLINTNLLLQTKIISKVFDGRAMTFPESHYVDILKNTATDLLHIFSFSNLEYSIPVLFWFLALGFFYAYRKFKWFKENINYLAVFFVLLNTYFVFLFQYNDLFIARDIFQVKPSIIEVLEVRESDPNTYRIMGFLLGDGLFKEVYSRAEISNKTSAILQRELLINNSNIFWDIQRMDGMEPYRTMRHHRLIDTVIAQERSTFAFDIAKLPDSQVDQLNNFDVFKKVSLEEKKKDFLDKLPILSMMNVKYIYSIYDLEDQNLKKIYNQAINIDDQIGISIHLYENTKVMPRVYFSTEPKFLEMSELKLLNQVFLADDYSKKTLIECSVCLDIKPEGGNIIVQDYQNGYLELLVDSKGENWLVFSESNMPGWTAWIDNKEVPIYDANYLFQAIQIPNGKHHVRFEYKDILASKIKKYLRN